MTAVALSPNALMPRKHSSRVSAAVAALVLILTLALGGCASMNESKKRNALEARQYAYSAAVRWGDFEGAWTMIEPEYREKHPMTDVDFSRYQQVQVSGYRDLASQPAQDGTQLREVQIDLINRHNLSQRSLRYTEVWRYDEKTETWWNIAGLPDFWQGQ